jgi:hypothetical protein
MDPPGMRAFARCHSSHPVVMEIRVRSGPRTWTSVRLKIPNLSETLSSEILGLTSRPI